MQKILFIIAVLLVSLSMGFAVAAEPSAPKTPRPYTLAIYLWPCYHPDTFLQSKLGKGWTEWELIKKAKPKVAGQNQPHVPLWGYRDESDPKVMTQSIDAIADAGIDTIIFDWYRYDDGVNNNQMLEAALGRGFLGAPNNGRLKFALMWANHDLLNMFPFPPGENFFHGQLWRSGQVSRKAFDQATDQAIKTYFHRPNYWKIDGRPFFSIYELHTTIRGLGGPEETRQAFADFRKRVQAAGFPDVHLNISYYSLLDALKIAKGKTVGGRTIETVNDLVQSLGVDSTNPYVWTHLATPTNYTAWMEAAMNKFDTIHRTLKVDSYPNVTMGWDGTPRNYGGSFVTDNTPERFEEALRRARSWLDKHPESKGILTLNAWNEWAEGGYLEPDTVHGTKYLDAVREVFGH